MIRTKAQYAIALIIFISTQCAALAVDRETGATSTELASRPQTQIALREGITFAEPGGQVLKLDMAMPTAKDKRYPVVVVLFGGGWISGSRTGMRERIQFVASNGYVAVAPSYRLAPEHPFPAAVADVRECVRWLRRHADEYSIDPDRIGAVGYSAGGHLACMLGLTADADSFGPDDVANDGTSARVQVVVNYFGPGDLSADAWSALAIRKYIVPFLGGTLDERPDIYRKASPITYVSSDDAPILTFQGDQDRTVPMSLSVALHEKLRVAGVANDLVIIEGQGHGWREPHRTQTRAKMIQFFDKHLKKK